MQPWESIDAYLRSVGVPVGAPTLEGTTGGSHVEGSLHPLGRARDYGDALNDCWRIYNALVPHAQGPNWILEELFWDPSGTGWKRGDNNGPEGGHSDHVHAGIGEGKVLPTIEGGTPAKENANPGVTGMLLQDRDSKMVWLVGPGHAHHVPSEDELNRLRSIGVPFREGLGTLEIIQWARTFGAWDEQRNAFRV
jgi:hypothetical protein